MLKQRIITGIVLLLLILGAVLLLSELYFTLFLGAVILMAAWEWAPLAGFRQPAARGAYLLMFAVALFLSWRHAPLLLLPVLLGSLVWWALACVLILNYPRFTALWGHRLFLGIAGLCILLPGWLGLLYLRGLNNFAVLIMLFFAAVAAADIGAYFSGRALGRNKLAPHVSPNKTWEGFWGGVLACCLLIMLAALVFRQGRAPMALTLWVQLAGFAVLLSATSVVGDLLESMIKRFRDVKDSGNILPGHGGILDRIDSISAAAPVYALLIMTMGVDLL